MWVTGEIGFFSSYVLCIYKYIVYNLMTFAWLMKYFGFVPMTVKFAFFFDEVVFHECSFYS